MKGIGAQLTMQAIFFPYTYAQPLVLSQMFEKSDVAYLNKINGVKITMQAHILALHTSSTNWWGQGHFFFISESSHVAGVREMGYTFCDL